MIIRQLDHVAIHVEDVEKTCEFYANVLRLDRMPRPAFDFPGAWFRLGETQELHIIGGRTDTVYSKNRGPHFALRVDDMDAWEDHLKACNATYRPRVVRPDRAYQIFVVDPDGYYIELCSDANTAPEA